MNVHEFWVDRCEELSEENDFADFKNWQRVRDIPLYSDFEYFQDYAFEVEIMIGESPRQQQWEDFLKKGEPFCGHSKESFAKACKTLSSGIVTTPFRLKTLHHLLTFEEMRNKSILDYDHIIEFGAGIGDIAHAVFELGFKGSYQIVDLAEIIRISNYYLDDYAIEKWTNINECIVSKNTLFIATWSLSEVPFSYRNQVVKKIKGSDYLIVFQKSFREINNTEYFINQWPYLTNSFYRIRQLLFHEADKGSVYLIGKSN